MNFLLTFKFVKVPNGLYTPFKIVPLIFGSSSGIIPIKTTLKSCVP